LEAVRPQGVTKFLSSRCNFRKIRLDPDTSGKPLTLFLRADLRGISTPEKQGEE
jgi:hypothetical protein